MVLYEHKRGRLAIYCPDCSTGRPFFFITTEKRFNNHCPKCHSYLLVRRCLRCGHEWSPRVPGTLPGVCPKCKSPYWDHERSQGRKKADWRE